MIIPDFRWPGAETLILTSLAIAEEGLQDLLQAIGSFEAAAPKKDSNLLGRKGESDLRAIERRIQKELFACTNAAASLVDHARRVDKLLKMPDYEAQKAACFGMDGLHGFVSPCVSCCIIVEAP